VTTHWSAAADLARAYPAVQVRADTLWSDLGDVVTSAGVAAALDCCLHLVRGDLGSREATELARALVTAPHRSGSQAQYIPIAVPDAAHDDPIERAWPNSVRPDRGTGRWVGRVSASLRFLHEDSGWRVCAANR
jgi:transcriptional regulator GlxA family with amidase domain